VAIGKRLFAEFIGTFWLVFGGCGSAVLAAKFLAFDKFPENSGPLGMNMGIGHIGVAFAFGLTVLTMAYAVGHISGGHFNPAVTLGLTAAKRFPASDVLSYIITQVVAAVAAAGVLYLIVSGKPDFAGTGGFAANGYAEGSPGKYNLMSCFLTEFLLTFFFLIIIIGATDKLAPSGFAPLAIGLGLALIHLIGIPVTNVSVNPARSTGPALFSSEAYAIPQLWLFWVAPILGAVAAGLVYKNVAESKDA
jgi:aquaporin Z